MALFVITFCVVQKTGEFTLLESKNFISKCFAPIESHRVKMNEFNTQWIVKITLRKNSNYSLVKILQRSLRIFKDPHEDLQGSS